MVDLTRVPERVSGAGAVYFPELPAAEWLAQSETVNPRDPRLHHRRYVRHTTAPAPATPA